MLKMVRVRYAPSPTGLLHIGNARTAIFNYLFARHHGGKFIIRIEDTDVERNVEGGEKSQLDNLSWLGIDWDESPDKGGPYGPYRQLERLDLYKKYADMLLEKGLAYKEYRDDSENYGIRFKVPKKKTYEFDDLVRGKLTFQSEEVEDWIIVKDNGIPTYNFAVVIDDHFMKITHVLRGEEHITNTPKQIMVYEAFGWDVPLFGHMTLIVNEEKKKLSKRDKNIVQFISQYKDLGYLPEALLNFITLLGWSPPINEEILSKEELIKLFDSNRLTKAPSMFDKDKLTFINHTYIKKMSEEEFLEFVRPFLENAGIKKEEDWLLKFSSMLQDRCSYGAQIVDLYNEFFKKEFKLTEEALDFLKQDEFTLLIETLKKNLSKSDFSLEKISEAIKKSGQEAEKKGKNLYMPVRIATTGLLHGPELAKMIYLLGKETVIKRIDKILEILEGKKI
ncbi:MAG: glutamate--tRNA ligase [Acholeplasmataceae bacterium]|nr:glutamate--tRNA ligase [Acholeplasmataceae bacterium]